MQYKNVSKKVLAFGMAFATACSAIFSMPQGVLAGTFIGPSAGTSITVVDYKNYPNQEMAYNAVKGGDKEGDKYGFSIRGDTQFYWVTKANQASRPTSFRYNVFGWTIVVTGSNGIVGTAEYANDGGIIGYGTNTTWANPMQYLSNGYYYRISSLEVKDLYNGLSNPAAMEGANFTVKAYPIITTKNAGSTINNGTIVQTSNGKVVTSGRVYRMSTDEGYRGLLNAAGWSNASRTTFENFHSGRTIIKDGGITDISIHPTEIQYYINGQNYCAYTVDSKGLIKNVADKYTKFTSSMSAKTLSNTELKATKVGYELDDYWTVCSEGDNPTTVPVAGYVNSSNQLDTNGDGIVKLKANWKKNKYYIAFDANGGKGTIGTLTTLYDDNIKLQDGSYLTKTGHYFIGWNTKPDGSGTFYNNQAIVKNLTATNNATVQLYAIWEAAEYEIDLNKCGGTGGDNKIFEKYSQKYSKESKGDAITSIVAPTKTGYQLEGYYTGKNGSGTKIINGINIVAKNTYFVSNRLLGPTGTGGIYANYTPNKINVTFDKQGGNEATGSNGVVVLYEKYYPSRETNAKGQEDGASLRAPVKEGYSFKGYYTLPDGKGSQVYSQTMCPTTYVCDIPSGTQTLYAYWVDNIAPTIVITPESLAWYNGGDDRIFQVEINANDEGSGLAKIEYQIDKTDIVTTAYNGEKNATINFDITTEGIQTITATAVDKAGNKTTTICTIYFDKTPPHVVNENPGTIDNVHITEFVVTDYK